MIKIRFFVSFIILLHLPILKLAAQNREYTTGNMFWSELNVIGNIKGKWNYQLDVQHRRLAPPENAPGNQANIFRYPLLQVVRPWLHYQLNPDLRFSFAPVAWVINWRLPNHDHTPFHPEFRITPQITHRHQIGRAVIQHRYRFEYRLVGRDHPVGEPEVNNAYTFDDSRRRGRFRYMARVDMPINNKTIVDGTFYGTAFDELMVNTGKNIPNTNFFDQNRVYAGLGYRFSKYFRLEGGYLRQTAFRFNNAAANNIENNNIFQVFVIFDQFSSLFKKEEPLPAAP